MQTKDARAKPRIACATLYDERFASIGWMCRNTLTRYGRRHGHDVVTARAIETDRPPPWHKVRFARALLDEGYDYVLWVDADAVIVDFTPDVRTLLRDDKDLHLVRHALGDFSRPVANTGVFLIRNSDWSRDLLDRMWALDRYATATWWENAALIHLLGEPGFESVGIPAGDGPQIDVGRIDWLSDRWNRLHEATDPGPPIVRHYAGRSRKHRLRRMPTHLNWPRAAYQEATRRAQPLDLTHRGVRAAMLHHAAPEPAPRAALRAAAA